MGAEKIIIGVVKDESGKIVTATCTDEKGARLALAHIFKERKEKEAKEWIRDRNRHACKEWLDKECNDFEKAMNEILEA